MKQKEWEWSMADKYNKSTINVLTSQNATYNY